MVEHAQNMTTKYHHIHNKTIHIYIITSLVIVKGFSVVMIQIAGIDIRSLLLFEASLINLARLLCTFLFLVDINCENLNNVGKDGLKYFILKSLNEGHVKTKWYSLSNESVLHNSQYR